MPSQCHNSLSSTADTYVSLNRSVRSETTVARIRLAVSLFSRCLGHPAKLEDLSDDNLARFEKWLSRGRSNYTIRDYIGRVLAVWRWSAKRGLVPTWPTFIRCQPPTPERPAWSIEEMRAIVNATARMTGDHDGVRASTWWRIWHLVQWETGERTGAMLKLAWSNFDVPRGGIYVPAADRKGKRKDAWYKLSRDLAAEMEAFSVPKRKLLFPWPWTTGTFYLHYRRLIRKAGLEPGRKNGPQRMRRSHLTHWAASGGDATDRAQHSSRDVTRVFYLDPRFLVQEDPMSRLPPIG